jgi:hypothetical protein
MADFGPLLMPARNAAHAAYLVRSRAEQRGVAVESVDVSEAGGGMWLVSVAVSDPERALAAHLADDTQTLHFDNHPSRRT